LEPRFNVAFVPADDAPAFGQREGLGESAILNPSPNRCAAEFRTATNFSVAEYVCSMFHSCNSVMLRRVAGRLVIVIAGVISFNFKISENQSFLFTMSVQTSESPLLGSLVFP